MQCLTTFYNIDDVPLEKELNTEGMGAVASFKGYVRNNEQQTIQSIFVEAHPQLTLPSLEKIVAEARQRFDLQDCFVIHRLGSIALNELIVGVAATSRHRQSAFDACMFIMDYLKNDALLWKKECFVDGSSAWVDMKQSDVAKKALWQQKTPEQN